jgi:hypothetical protein
MTETVVPFPRSKEWLTRLVRNILGDITAIAITIDETFDEYSPEQLDELKRRLELIQTEVESLRDYSPHEVAGWITG